MFFSDASRKLILSHPGIFFLSRFHRSINSSKANNYLKKDEELGNDSSSTFKFLMFTMHNIHLMNEC